MSRRLESRGRNDETKGPQARNAAGGAKNTDNSGIAVNPGEQFFEHGATDM
jgi:hypothetical protein